MYLFFAILGQTFDDKQEMTWLVSHQLFYNNRNQKHSEATLNDLSRINESKQHEKTLIIRR